MYTLPCDGCGKDVTVEHRRGFGLHYVFCDECSPDHQENTGWRDETMTDLDDHGNKRIRCHHMATEDDQDDHE